MKNKILLSIFCLLILISSVRCSCDNNTTKIITENATTTEKKKAQKLSQVKNAKIDENYLLTFDKVENAISYEISFDLFDYVDIGNVNSYDLSSCYGSEVAIRAVGDKTNYTNSTPVILNLEHYKTVFTSFEGLAGEDEWSGALVWYADILGTTNEKAHTGENSFKIFASNKSTYFGGTLFDTEYYAPYGAIDFQNVKTISYWVYVDTKDLTQIEELCNKYGSHYNADVANFDYFHGYEGHGLLEVFYDESETGTPKTFDEFDNQLYETNKWVKFTFDVSKYKVISDLVLMYGNSDRTFTGNNEPGNWSVTSEYAYIIYYDDIEVEYEPIKLDTVEEILLEDKTFAFTEVENASYYMVTVDGINYTKVTDAEYTVDSLPGMFGVKACNETKYSDGSSRYLESDTKYYIKNNAEKLASVTNLKTIVVDDAVYKNAISWTKNPNAYGYSVSTDGINYTYVGDVDTYKVDRIYGVNKVYVKALSNEMNYKDSDSVECKIPNLYNLADFEGDRSYYIGNDNFTAISLSSDSYYGNNSFMIYRTVADCEGMPYARCHVQPELLNNVDFSKVTFVNFYLKVEDIYKGEEQLDCLYNGYASCFFKI